MEGADCGGMEGGAGKISNWKFESMSKLELIDGRALLVELFPDEKSRPGLRTLRTWQKERLIPYHRIGRGVFFCADEVRAEFEAKRKVKARR